MAMRDAAVSTKKLATAHQTGRPTSRFDRICHYRS